MEPNGFPEQPTKDTLNGGYLASKPLNCAPLDLTQRKELTFEHIGLAESRILGVLSMGDVCIYPGGHPNHHCIRDGLSAPLFFTSFAGIAFWIEAFFPILALVDNGHGDPAMDRDTP